MQKFGRDIISFGDTHARFHTWAILGKTQVVKRVVFFIRDVKKVRK